MEEEWRPVRDWPEYEVSNLGTVRTLPRTVMRRNGVSMLVLGRVRSLVRQGGSHENYVGLCLKRPGERKTVYVHRLVLDAFVGPCPEGLECRHFPDPDTSNNRLDNLSWGTRVQNHADKRSHGTSPTGERHPMAKLTAEDVRKIRQLRSTGQTLERIAQQFGVTWSNVWAIVQKRTWRHVLD